MDRTGSPPKLASLLTATPPRRRESTAAEGQREGELSPGAVTAQTAQGPTFDPLPRAVPAQSAHPPGEGAQVVSLTEFRDTKRALSSDFDSKAFGSGRPQWSDVHFHPTNYAQQGLRDFSKLLEFMKAQGIFRTVLSPIPTNQLVSKGSEKFAPAQSGHTSQGCCYYLPKVPEGDIVTAEFEAEVMASDPLSYNNGVDASLAAAYQRFAKKASPEELDRFDCMVTGLTLGDERCSEMLLRLLFDFPGVFTGVGEITVHKEFVQGKVPVTHQASLVADKGTVGILPLIKTCGTIGMPMVIHCDADVLPYRREPGGKPVYFGPARDLFARPECQGTTIIWAHVAGVGRFSTMRDDHLKAVDQLLSDPKLKHVNIDISWDVVARQLVNTDGSPDKEKAGKWAALFEKHADRILFGSDCLAPMSHESWGSTKKAYEGLLATLKSETRQKILLGNYERLIVGARERVRAYEQHCLPHAMTTIDMRPEDPAFPATLVKAELGLLKGRVAVELTLAKGNTSAEPVRKAMAELERHVTSSLHHDDTSYEVALARGKEEAQSALDEAQAALKGETRQAA